MSKLNKIQNYKFLLGTLVFLILAGLFEKNIRIHLNEDDEFKRVESIINSRIEKVDIVLNEIELSLDSLDLKDLMLNPLFFEDDLYENEGIVYLGYESDSLVFWTNNAIPVENFKVDNQLYNKVAKLKNGWFVIRQTQFDNYQLFGLVLIKNDYSYQNEFIRSDYFHEYKLDIPAKITLESEKGYQVKDPKGEYLFSFYLTSNLAYNYFWIYLSGFFYLLALIALFAAIRRFISRISSKKFQWISLVLLAAILVLIRYLMLEYHFPSVFRRMDLFQPHYFAISNAVPSLGDLFLHALFVFFYMSVFSKCISFKLPRKNYLQYITLIIFTGITFGVFVLFHHYFESLILHSSISFEGYKFFDLSIYSLIGYLVIVLLLSSFFFLIDLFLRKIQSEINFRQFLIIFVSGVLVLFYFTNLLIIKINYLTLFFLLLIVVYDAAIRLLKGNFTYPLRVVFILILALYTTYFITSTSQKKDRETRKVLAVNLANEHDQVAEMLLEGIEQELEKDTVVRDLLTWHYQNEGAILEHLQMTYFSGYFRKYDLQISVCNPNDDLTLILENSTEIVHCYNFFDNLFENDGTKLSGSNFYFLDNLNGRISYLGKFTYKKSQWENEVSLFISLDSKLVSQELGYPELLLDNRMSGSAILSGYSYAKYKNNDLMNRSGEFSYQLTFPKNWKSDQEFYFTTDQNFEHLIYRIDDHTEIVFSSEKIQFVDLLASFSYIFVFYFIILSLVFFAVHFPDNVKGFNYDFKNKIKFSMIGVLLLSLVIVGFGTIFYNVNQFERNLYESIGEKIQSVLVEMEHKLGGDFELNNDYSDYLNYLLIKFSNVFYIDINLYDVNGNLLASSRSQIFEKGLMGNKMNIDAYREMVVNRSGKFIHKESIGDLSYYSAYVPFTNYDNTLLAYINLPYFTKQSALKKEIYTIVVAVVNIYFFLILLSVIVAIFISNNITRPLQLIQERFRAIDLGKQNEPIRYNSKDEIGSLIKEYNRMVSELSENAEKLAKSERESAWREMAKQIAHEIKNPLTPMKLSVQYLQKAWKDGKPDFDQRLEKFAASLISQINNLSSIATEFSNFAKMPRAQAQQVNIISKLNDTITLFENSENISFIKEYNEINELNVYADKEQILIVFSNLIQNAIQAIPKERNGQIIVRVNDDDDYVKVEIIDNGTGITEDLKPKLFTPNFTTKTSGMGLGLSIVKNIVENAGGEIWYKTEIDKGTSFYVSFPKFKFDE